MKTDPICTTDSLTKILSYLKSSKVPVNITLIWKGIGGDLRRIKKGMSWLVSHKLVVKVKGKYPSQFKDMWLYSLPKH